MPSPEPGSTVPGPVDNRWTGGEAATGVCHLPHVTACRRPAGSVDSAGVPTLVIIEDETVLARNLGKAFSRRGFTVREAGTIAEGLRAVEEARPEVVLMDLRLRTAAVSTRCRGSSPPTPTWPSS